MLKENGIVLCLQIPRNRRACSLREIQLKQNTVGYGLAHTVECVKTEQNCFFIYKSHGTGKPVPYGYIEGKPVPYGYIEGKPVPYGYIEGKPAPYEK